MKYYKSRVLKLSNTNKITLYEYKHHHKEIKCALDMNGSKADILQMIRHIIIGVCMNGLLKANKSSLCTIQTVVTENKLL